MDAERPQVGADAHPPALAVRLGGRAVDASRGADRLLEAAARLDAAGVDALLWAAPGEDDTTPALDPALLSATVAAATARIGLVVPVDAGRDAPFTVARRLAALDHLSGGRAAWRLRGGTAGRRRELVDVVTALWDSFDDGAMVRDRETARYYRPEGLRTPHHRGPDFTVRGPLNVSRPPQGHPPLVVDGSVPEDLAGVDVVVGRELPGDRSAGDGADAAGRRGAAPSPTPRLPRRWVPVAVGAGSPPPSPAAFRRALAEAGADGVLLLVRDPEGLDAAVVAAASWPGAAESRATTLRQRLGLPRPPARARRPAPDVERPVVPRRPAPSTTAEDAR
ncbi:LLM class flavin-dependent oxidoreductase [Patulibacter sp. NPDC049589]|uniref:LLM class flavin-dependent oxidoreductase n=1 Tax=Patulibacter sp. NPDC049589 TaxID=3154731 RepID=UPI00342948C6